jgi:HAD superfamily hydrolase (TIGR01509 family)
MEFQHIIFDCDGVLVDSEPLSMKVDQVLLAENGIMMSEEEVTTRYVGFTFGALIAKVEMEFGIHLPEGISEEKDRRLLALYERELVATAGALDVARSLSLPKSVASNSPRQRVEAAFRITGLGAFFNGNITTFEDVCNGKPAPDIYLLAAERAGVSPSECLVVEDSRAGVISAVAAGCPVIGFAGLAHDREAAALMLRQSGAIDVLFSLYDLPAAISDAGNR